MAEAEEVGLGDCGTYLCSKKEEGLARQVLVHHRAPGAPQSNLKYIEVDGCRDPSHSFTKHHLNAFLLGTHTDNCQICQEEWKRKGVRRKPPYWFWVCWAPVLDWKNALDVPQSSACSVTVCLGLFCPCVTTHKWMCYISSATRGGCVCPLPWWATRGESGMSWCCQGQADSSTKLGKGRLRIPGQTTSPTLSQQNQWKCV